MVEQQVVGLEAEGSTPSIYPLFSAGLVPNLSHSKILKNKIIIYIINMLRVR